MATLRAFRGPRPAVKAAARPMNLRSRSTAVKVVAFRDTHRAEQLEATAKEFSTAWAGAICAGPEKALHMLEHLCDENVAVRSMHPLGCASSKGVNSLKAKMQRDYKALVGTTSQPKSAKVILTGCDDAADTAFCLLEISFFTFPGREHIMDKAYLLLEMQMMLDDTVRRVINVVERGQITNGFPLPMASLEHPCYPAFPIHLLQPWNTPTSMKAGTRPGSPAPDMVEAVNKSIKSWVMARDSKTATETMMAAAGCNDQMVFLDAYGMMPLCEPGISPLTGVEGCMPLNQEQVMDMLEGIKETHVVESHVLDVGVCLNQAAGFTQWRAKQTDKATGETLEIEGMEVNVFDPETGALKGVYLFRDAMDMNDVHLVA